MPARAVWCTCLLVGLGLAAGGCGGRASATYRIGVIAGCEPQGTGLQYERSFGGAELPFLRRGAKLVGQKPSGGVHAITIGGTRVELLLRCANEYRASSDLDAARRLVELEGADVVVTPFATNVGSVIALYARERPSTTFIPTDLEPTATLNDPPPNVFRFQPDGAQVVAGLGAYAYRTLGWRKVATVGEDDPFGWPQVAGFVAEFCSLGGDVVQRLWASSSELDYSGVVRQIRTRDADGVFFPGGPGGGAQSFVTALGARYRNLGRHLIVGTIPLLTDQTPRMLGVVGGSEFPYSATPVGTRYVADLKRLTGQDTFLLDTVYFKATEAVLEALEQVHGDVSDRGRRFRQALAALRLRSPLGIATLDKRHQAVVPTYLGRLERGTGGKLFVRQIRVVPNVEQTFGGYFTPSSPPSSDTQPSCRHGNPPPWAR